jgi:hypothetical protein
MRGEAARALARQESPQILLDLAEYTPRLNSLHALQLTSLAERLMFRHYRRIEPAGQSALRAAMGRLTSAALEIGWDPNLL